MRRCFSSTRVVSKEKIAMVGSGNFGSALTRILGSNALAHADFDDGARLISAHTLPRPPRATARCCALPRLAAIGLLLGCCRAAAVLLLC